ncbi:hypothetical protein GGU11DRAFT_760420 [Lentinula aff. detonsa]|nr:hypothetical protein GGU11DRAFT_760420 [Lentinula aff. detonsa]
MSHELQPRSLIFSPSRSDNMQTAQDEYIVRLLARPMFRKLFSTDDPGVLKSLDAAWDAFLCAMDLRATNENDIQAAQRQVYNIVCQLATLVLFPITEKQLTQLLSWKILAPRSRIDAAPVANILLGSTSAAELEDAYSRIQRYHNSECESLLDLRSSVITEAAEPSLRTIFSQQCQSLALGNPLGYVTLLLLVQLSEMKQLPVPHGIWIKPDCQNCSAFSSSHAVLELRKDSPSITDSFVFPLPIDQNSYRPLSEINTRNSDTLNPDILVEIVRVLGFSRDGGGAGARSQDPNLTALDDTAFSVDDNNFRECVQRSLSKLLPQIPCLGESGIGLRDIMPWIIPVRSMFVQLWSGMVHHNVTFGELSSHNHSFKAERIPNFGQAKIGPFQEVTQPGHLLIKALDVITAFEDAMARFKTHTSIWESSGMSTSCPAMLSWMWRAYSAL